MIGRQFTSGNSLPEPTYEKLDRVLMDTNQESKFTMVLVHALEGIVSFLPILLTTGLNSASYSEKVFMPWSNRFGKDKYADVSRYRGGIIKCVPYPNTCVVGPSSYNRFT
jgi:hypothetical protein